MGFSVCTERWYSVAQPPKTRTAAVIPKQRAKCGGADRVCTQDSPTDNKLGRERYRIALVLVKSTGSHCGGIPPFHRITRSTINCDAVLLLSRSSTSSRLPIMSDVQIDWGSTAFHATGATGRSRCGK
jgi:hypothetical protein